MLIGSSTSPSSGPARSAPRPRSRSRATAFRPASSAAPTCGRTGALSRFSTARSACSRRSASCRPLAPRARPPQGAPLVTMRIIDDSGSLFRPPPVAFQASEIGLEAFGWNIENTALVAGLIGAARAEPHLQLTSEDAGKTTLGEDVATIALSGGSAVAARLVVAADGRNSRLREAAGIATRSWSYPQSALATHLSHERDHRDASTEFHTRSGPFTLVPMVGRRSSLVWVTNRHHTERLMKLDDEELSVAIERQAQSILGQMRIDGPRGLVPMSGLSVERYVADRLALVGEAAHVFPPI